MGDGVVARWKYVVQVHMSILRIGMETRMKYDDASYYVGGGSVPNDLPAEASGTRIGMYAAWAFLSGLGSKDFPELLGVYVSREETPGAIFMDWMDEELTDADFSDEGNSFTESYYDVDPVHFFADYEEILCKDVETIFHVADTWDNFNRLKPRLDRRFNEWQIQQKILKLKYR